MYIIGLSSYYFSMGLATPAELRMGESHQHVCIDFHSEENVAKRKALRREPIVVAALDVWWTTATASVHLGARQEVEHSAEPKITKDQMITVGMKMCAAYPR